MLLFFLTLYIPIQFKLSEIEVCLVLSFKADILQCSSALRIIQNDFWHLVTHRDPSYHFFKELLMSFLVSWDLHPAVVTGFLLQNPVDSGWIKTDVISSLNMFKLNLFPHYLNMDTII